MKISSIEEEENHQQKTVVVGVKMDPQSKELLTWALVKAAKTGDRVVALHIIPTNSEVYGGKFSSLLSIVKAFDSLLAVYDGFCNLKQVDLKLKLCRGSSVRKALVRESISHGANSLILGVDRSACKIRYSSTSMAKYCSKKLPKDCSVLAVNNGKILYHRKSAETKHSSKIHKTGNYDYLFMTDNQLRKNFEASRPSLQCFPTISSLYHSSTLKEEKDNSIYSRKGDSLALVPLEKSRSKSSSIRTLIVRELHEEKPGWPSLRKAVFTDKKIRDGDEKSKVSVIQWVMRLPIQYIAPPTKYSNCKAEAPFERTDSSCSSVTILEEENETPTELRSLQEKYSSICRLFSYQELASATSNFSSDNLIGKGGSSQVYKGYLSKGEEVAVKLLKQSEDAVKVFVSEIEILTTLHHKNIISLLGLCFDNDNLILVYNYLSKGSLEEILHGNQETNRALTWVERYKIALGIAEALTYLHNDSNDHPVIHRDVKSSNILITDGIDPQLADFGLALRVSPSLSHMTCNDVSGTFGYLAPEYFMYGRVNDKIDVYAFGVVLLELLSGRKPVNSECPKGEESLVLWAKKIFQDGKMKQLVDPLLKDEYENEELERIILAVSACIRKDPLSRPPIAHVLKLLRGDPDIVQWAKLQDNNEESDELEFDTSPPSSRIQSYINLALLDVKDDTFSSCSVGTSVDFISANTSLEDYIKGRWSRSTSFD